MGEDEEESALNLNTEKLELPGKRNLEFKKIEEGHKLCLNPKETELPNLQY